MSESLWWSMPGPRRFVESVLESLRDGRSVAVWFPEHHPAGFLDALERAGDLSGVARWHRREIDVAEPSPARALHDLFAPLEAGVTPTMQTLIEAEGFRNCMASACVRTSAEHERWTRFLNDYRTISKPLTQYERPVLCVVFVGLDPKLLPKNDVTLAVEEWWARSDSLDMRLFVSHLFRAPNLPPLVRAAIIDVIASLSCADPVLAVELAEQQLEDILEPQEVLNRYAGRIGWTSATDEVQARRSGGIASIDGNKVWHSAALAAQQQLQRLRRRVWRGQVSHVFPFLEDRRLELVNDSQDFLPTAPFSLNGETIGDIHELEIGQIAYLLPQRKAPPHLIQRARRLRDARNCLAHLTPLDVPGLRTLASYTRNAM